MPTLEDAEPLVGATAPDTDIIESTGNKFTRSHSPRTEDNKSNDSPAGSQRTTIECPPDNEEHDNEDHLLTPNVHSGTPDLIMDQPPKDQPTQQDAPIQKPVLSAFSQLMTWSTHCKFYLHLLHLLWVPPPITKEED